MPPTPAPDLRRGQLNHRYEEIVGDHPSLVLALQTIDHIVETEIPVYVHGESGTGKELFARAIHFNGPRKDGAFMALNCAAVPEQLLESELFGHVRGAFTGATADRKGLFEMADDGTLFLDEVGDMSLAMQAKLLRVLQEGEVRRVGSARTKKVDVRVVAASHQDLAALVEKGDFRQDVYYRLCAITVKIPALRERRSDIPLLLQYFLAAESAERGAAAPAIDPRVAEVLGSLEWPGNVRQLLNVVRTAWALGGGRQIGAAEVSMALGQPHPSLMAVPPSGSPVAGPPAAGAPSPPPQDFPFQPPASPASDSYNLADRERQAIMAAIQQAGGNKVQAAKNLGISRRTLYRKIERYGIKDQV
jgi:DNA-binding NtrC family response regulator